MWEQCLRVVRLPLKSSDGHLAKVLLIPAVVDEQVFDWSHYLEVTQNWTSLCHRAKKGPYYRNLVPIGRFGSLLATFTWRMSIIQPAMQTMHVYNNESSWVCLTSNFLHCYYYTYVMFQVQYIDQYQLAFKDVTAITRAFEALVNLAFWVLAIVGKFWYLPMLTL